MYILVQLHSRFAIHAAQHMLQALHVAIMFADMQHSHAHAQEIAFCVSTGPDDIPKGGSTEACGQALFARDKVEYHGQIVGLIVAKSQVGRFVLSALMLTP